MNATVEVVEDAIHVVETIPPESITIEQPEGAPVVEILEGAEVLAIEVGVSGPQGVRGFKGDKGDKGDIGGTYQHTQATPSAFWVINHDLGFRPNVTVTDSAGTPVIGDVRYPDIDTVTIQFLAGFSGEAYLS